MKVDSGSFAVFSEKGSSASKMTVAKVTDVIARVPGCAGQASDAGSGYTHIKMEYAPGLMEFSNSECPDFFLDTSATTQVTNILVKDRRTSDSC